MKKIYILLMHTNTLPSKLVKIFTRYKYSHVAISLEENCHTTYSFGRRSLYNILNGGFSIQTKDGEFFKKFNNTECVIYEVNVTQKEYESLKNILENMISNQKKYKYDFFGIIPRLFNLPVALKNKYVCSYFVAEILQKANIITFNKPTCLVVPKDFAMLDKLIKIYEGKYLLYE